MKNNKNLSTILLISILLLSGCTEKASSANNLEERINELSTRLDTATTELDTLKKESSKVAMNEMFRSWESIAFLNTGSTNFSPIKTDVGTITVNIADIQPFANGSKVTLAFGNPLNANLSSIKFTVDYGSLDENGAVIDGTEKSKEIKLAESFNAGSWIKSPIVLEGLPFAELGYIRVHDFTISSIALRGSNK